MTFSLIDIACHQAGAQVLTLLFTSAPNSIRDLMIQTVVRLEFNGLYVKKIAADFTYGLLDITQRRNGVTMKSSKAGSKIVSLKIYS
jgi:hypothetical protein